MEMPQHLCPCHLKPRSSNDSRELRVENECCRVLCKTNTQGFVLVSPEKTGCHQIGDLANRPYPLSWAGNSRQGQGPNQKDLLHYCKEPSIDVIVLSFIHLFPAQANGLPGSNFGNQCRGAVYQGPGRDRSRDALQADCPRLRSQVAACQRRHGKKLLLSLGGGTSGYQLTGAAAGRAFADQLWALFGPPDRASRLPRPFGDAADLDGFDLDIEHPPTDGGAGYRALAAGLRAHFASPAGRRKPRYLTASPQCVVPDSNLSAVVRAVRFDALFIR
ncbi:acidic endochitinase SE2 [Gaeumannomyces tritici R3-111a-1]|uniref:chitinase n=1 Tax=Gaeumannomyces tritici (strain R3-111a-1) TaxID=644352 RepID=J3NI67_GAET3|nr:acidic endochitinase SE2 [Gaeumannomyces tritici R3-111a-1]EJT80960.1 acidic endochitinase SE2 [Gaeumannomyces tritici R3-111a-1]